MASMVRAVGAGRVTRDGRGRAEGASLTQVHVADYLQGHIENEEDVDCLHCRGCFLYVLLIPIISSSGDPRGPHRDPSRVDCFA